MGLRVTAGWLLSLAVVVALTLLTQIGSLIRLLSLCISRRWRGAGSSARFLVPFTTTRSPMGYFAFEQPTRR